MYIHCTATTARTCRGDALCWRRDGGGSLERALERRCRRRGGDGPLERALERRLARLIDAREHALLLLALSHLQLVLLPVLTLARERLAQLQHVTPTHHRQLQHDVAERAAVVTLTGYHQCRIGAGG